MKQLYLIIASVARGKRAGNGHPMPLEHENDEGVFERGLELFLDLFFQLCHLSSEILDLFLLFLDG